jgi:hypothetical protein
MIEETTKTTYYVILMNGGRVGSTYLTTALSQHPQVWAFGEGLSPRKEKGIEAQNSWLNTFFESPEAVSYKAWGFKTKLLDILDRDYFESLLYDKNIHVILLKRRNLVKQTISWINSIRVAEATGDYNIFQDSDRPTLPHIDINDFDEKLRIVENHMLKFENYTNSLKAPILSLFYEDILVNVDLMMEKILTFLNVPNIPLEAKTKKVTSDDLRHAIVNFEELRQHLSNTKYQSLVDEVLIPSSFP